MAEIKELIVGKVRRFVEKLRDEGINVESAYLFGSFAKGGESKWSDIDVAIISSDISGY